MNLKYGPYSPSRLDTAICGHAFHRQYVGAKERAPENLPQARGSAVHEVFEQITQKMIEDPQYAFEQKEVRAWVVEAVNRHPAALQALDEILEMCRLYILSPPRS